MHLALVFTWAAAVSGAAVLRERRSNSTVNPLSLPWMDQNSTARAESIQIKRQTFLYGPGPDQNVTAYPAGPLGNSTWQADLAEFQIEENAHQELVNEDMAAVAAALEKGGGLQSLANLSIIFDGQWNNSMGNLQQPSFYANYTNDLLFSMQRLTINPFSIRRLSPTETLPFQVDAATAKQVATKSAEDLLSEGRLFYVDYSSLSDLPRQPGRYSAACEAYFYIHPDNGTFLPLAIQTNEGSNLVYTPADSPADWLFGKILFGENDLWNTPWSHFAATHLVVELPYDAAYRCMADNHPVLAMYKIYMLHAFAFRQFIENKLYAPGALVDQFYVFNGSTASDYTVSLYEQGEKLFQGNYFKTRLQNQGLVDSRFGPPLQDFPFAEDATKVLTTIREFMTSYLNSYYTSPHMLAKDKELACWFEEAKIAGSQDFPTGPGSDTSTLIDILTHAAYLSGIQHQTMNTNDQWLNALLPLSPTALYKELPTAKGLSEDDILAYLPNATQIISQLGLAAAFSRPEFVNTNKTLINVFTDPDLLSSFNDQSREAAAVYQASMANISTEISQRTFDENGLSQGAPFLWKALDPRVAPYSMTI